MTSKLIVNSIRHTGASADAITMDASGNVTFPANATCSGTATGFGGGKILKQDYLEYTSEFSTNSTSYVDVDNMAFNFTPSAAGSKIWLMCTPQIATEDQVQTADAFIALRSGSTTLFETKEWNYTYSGNTWRTVYTRNLPIQNIHTPTYTLGDSINYKLSIKKVNSEIRVNYNSNITSNFSIFEIGS